MVAVSRAMSFLCFPMSCDETAMFPAPLPLELLQQSVDFAAHPVVRFAGKGEKKGELFSLVIALQHLKRRIPLTWNEPNW